MCLIYKNIIYKGQPNKSRVSSKRAIFLKCF